MHIDANGIFNSCLEGFVTVKNFSKLIYIECPIIISWWASRADCPEKFSVILWNSAKLK